MAKSWRCSPILKKVLDDHRVRVKGKDQDYIFAGERRGTPLNLENLAKRVIKPALAKNELELLKWKGWHAFRRSLATNLYSCGVAPKVIQAILRHSDIGTTLAYLCFDARRGSTRSVAED
jgi:site-specific recombinase XerD